MSQMYKVFFNDRTIFLSDTLPEINEVPKDYLSAFGNASDLRPQLKHYLNSNPSVNLHIYHDDIDELWRVFSSCFLNIMASGGLVKNDRDENLIIFRRGRWDLPKGKSEEGEDPEQTALREVGEECQIQGLEIMRFLISTYHIYFLDAEPVLKKTDWYEMKYRGINEPQPLRSEGIEKTIWLAVDHLDKISNNTFPTVLDVIQAGEG